MERNSFLKISALSVASLFIPSVWENLLAAGDNNIHIRSGKDMVVWDAKNRKMVRDQELVEKYFNRELRKPWSI